MTTDNERPTSANHLPNGQFAPGNPGRPKGVKNKLSIETLRGVQSMMPDAVAMLRAKIAQGDLQAILYVLSHSIPKGRTVELDGVTPNDIASMLVNGELTTSEARDIAVTLSKLAEVGEIAEIRSKIEQLEKLLNNGKA